MSSHKLTKSHSENLSNNQIHLNGLSHKRSLTKQEEVDLTPDHNSKHHPSEVERSVKAVHSISICINNFEENSSEENMRQEMVRNVSEDTETSSLADGVKEIQIEDDDLRQSADTSALPLSDHCDAKDKKRTKHLVRCEAVRESSLSPPPASLEANEVNSNKISFNTTNHLTVYSNNKNVTVIKSSPLNKSSSNSNSAASSPSLSRDSSTENNVECSGAELLAFLTESLKKSQKDRMYMLRIEQEIIQLMKDSSKESHKFSSGSSYNRMLIHRVAAYFGLEHNVDHTHTSVIVSKTKSAHMPELKLKELIKDDESTDEPKKLILKRDSTSLEDSSGSSFDKDRSPESHLNGSFSDSSRSRSLEEREENYERVRARIFNNSNNSSINEEHKVTGSPAASTSPSKASEKTATAGAKEPKASSAEGDGKVVATAAADAPAKSTSLQTASSLETESQSDCDKPKGALLPNNSASVAAAAAGGDEPISPVPASSAANGGTSSADAVSSSATATTNSKSSSHAPNESAKRAAATSNNSSSASNNSNGRYNDRDNSSNRGRYGNMRNRGYSEQGGGGGGGYHRYSQNRKMDTGNRGGDNNGDWSLKPNLNAKLASQNMPYNFFYPNVVDGGHYGHRPFPPALNHHAPMAGQFSLGGGGNPYMQSPLLANEQLFPQVNYVNSPAMSLPLVSNNQAHVPNSMLNQISYSHGGANSSTTSSTSSFLPSANHLSMPNNYQQFMQYSMQQPPPPPLCGPNAGVPYSPPGSNPLPLPPNSAAAVAAAYSSMMGMSPYHQQAAAAAAVYHHQQQLQHQQQQQNHQHANQNGPPMPLNLMAGGGGMPPHPNSYKQPNLNDYDLKACNQMKGANNYGKVPPAMHQQQQSQAAAAAAAAAAQLNPHYALGPAYPPSPEVLDRSAALGQVQFNAGAAAHMVQPPPELMMNSRAAAHLHHHPAAAPPPHSAAAFALNYGNKSRYPNDVLLGNPNQLSQQQQAQAQAQAAMYLSQQQQQQQQQFHQQKQYYGTSDKPNGAVGGGGRGGKFPNGGRGGRRGGGGGGGPNPNRRY